MLLTKTINVKWHANNKKYYEDLGYNFTKLGEEFEVNTNDLSKYNQIYIKYKCDICNKEIETYYKNYCRNKKNNAIDNKDYCNECSSIKVKQKLIDNAIVKNGSLSEKFPEIAKEWSPKNKKGPNKYNCYSRKRVLWICKRGHEFEASPDDRTRRNINCQNCPKENKDSRGEKEVIKILDKYNIIYSQQYLFKNLLSENNNPLKFDFALFKNKELKCLVEFDGIQHFQPTFGEEIFKQTIYRDNLKEAYCYENNIPLIRIKYDEFEKIEEILLICAFHYLLN